MLYLAEKIQGNIYSHMQGTEDLLDFDPTVENRTQ